MDAVSSFIPLVLFVGLVVMAALLARQANIKRRMAVREMADRFGFTYAERDDGVLSSIRDFKLYQPSHSSEDATNVMRKSGTDSEVLVFDYHWRRGSGKNSTSATHTVLWFQSPLLKLPRFALSGENFFHKIGEMLGFKDIDFERHPDFSDRFRLTGPAEPEIRTFFADRRIEDLERMAGKFCIEGNRGNMVIYRPMMRVPLKGMPEFIKQGLDLAGIFKG